VLGFKTCLEVNSFLRKHGAFSNYTPSEIDQEIKTNERLLERRSVNSGCDDRHCQFFLDATASAKSPRRQPEASRPIPK